METANDTAVKKPQVPRTDVYKGNPVLILNPEDKWPFSFGLTKAKLILQNLEAIRSFVDAHQKETNEGKVSS